MEVDIVQKTADYVRNKLSGEATGHDWYHIRRVWKLAKMIQSEEGGDLKLIELSSLLHDLGDTSQYEFDNIKGSFMLYGMMDVIGIDSDLQKEIVQVIDESHYKGRDSVTPSTIEGKIVQDSDWLDSLGALGVARSFATGGKIGRVLHDPNRKPKETPSAGEIIFRKKDGTSLNYFYEKVLRLPDLMNTRIGKELAQKRAEFTKLFLKEFSKEWDCLDSDEF